MNLTRASFLKHVQITNFIIWKTAEALVGAKRLNFWDSLLLHRHHLLVKIKFWEGDSDITNIHLKAGILFAFLFWVFSAASSPLFASKRIEGKDRNQKPYSISLTYFNWHQKEKLFRFAEEISHSVDERITVFDAAARSHGWLLPEVQKSQVPKQSLIFVKEIHRSNGFKESKEKKVSAVAAVVRTAYSSFFWIIVSDFSTLQNLTMITLQGALQYAFTYKGYFFNILNFSKNVGLKGLELFSLYPENEGYSKTVKLATQFNLGITIGAVYMGVVSWENFAETFSQMKTYGELAYFSLLNMFATGGWGVFLSSESEKIARLKKRLNLAFEAGGQDEMRRIFHEWSRTTESMPLLSSYQIKSIYLANGVVLSLGFPLLINDYVAGSYLLITTGLTGLVMMHEGSSFLKKFHRHRCRLSI